MINIKVRKLFNFNDEFFDYKILKFFIDCENNIILAAKDSKKSYIIYFNNKNNIKSFYPLINGIDIDDILFIQPVVRENWVIICNAEKENAMIINHKGEILNKFFVGEGVQDCQVDKFNNIWISYSEEGIFGEGCIGKTGLVAFDIKGSIVFNNFDTIIEMYDIPPIDDCQAMNVKDDEVWLHYYSDYPLVNIKSKKFNNYWANVEIGENIVSNGFAIGKDQVLFGTNKQKLVLYSLSKRCLYNIDPYNDQGEKIQFNCYLGRGSILYLQTRNSIYFVDLLEEK